MRPPVTVTYWELRLWAPIEAKAFERALSCYRASCKDYRVSCCFFVSSIVRGGRGGNVWCARSKFCHVQGARARSGIPSERRLRGTMLSACHIGIQHCPRLLSSGLASHARAYELSTAFRFRIWKALGRFKNVFRNQTDMSDSDSHSRLGCIRCR